jgi:imidazolonepropionase-like amidohydrolase
MPLIHRLPSVEIDAAAPGHHTLVTLSTRVAWLAVEFDLGLERGEVVASDGRRQANLYVRGGRIAEVTRERRPARERVDAAGLLVMAGMIDAHVHFMDPGDADREDFPPAPRPPRAPA